tara:strand:- start:126 stop:509 length:384 start_codon:yes stop_codon:yes gene_type:complete
MKKDWKKEVARDLIALGSIPFYIIVIIRAIIGEHMPFVNQLVISIILVSLLSLVIKKADYYITRGLILVVFTSLFYNTILFTVFVILIFLGMIISSYYRENKINVIINGCIFGVVISLVSYYLSFLF